MKQALSSAAESTIGRSVPGRNTPQCQAMAALSKAQRQLRLRIQNTTDNNRCQNLKQQRNRIRRKARDNASNKLDHLASDVERLHDGAKMLRAVREMSRKPAGKVRIHDDAGRVICDAHELNERVTDNFSRLFNGGDRTNSIHRGADATHGPHHCGRGHTGDK